MLCYFGSHVNLGWEIARWNSRIKIPQGHLEGGRDGGLEITVVGLADLHEHTALGRHVFHPSCLTSTVFHDKR